MKKLAIAAFLAANLALNAGVASAKGPFEKVCIEVGPVKVCGYPR